MNRPLLCVSINEVCQIYISFINLLQQITYLANLKLQITDLNYGKKLLLGVI